MTINTSTTAGKIAVMQHYENNGLVRYKGRLATANWCVASTERDNPDWTEQALTTLRIYARICERYRRLDPSQSFPAYSIRPFTGEDFRTWAEAKGLPPPKDARAYGPVIAKAIRDGLIVKAGYAPTVSSHGSVRATYRRAS